MTNNRRRFIKNASIAATALSLAGKSFGNVLQSESIIKKPKMKSTSSISVFSKNLHWLSINDMANAVAEMGFDGIDLTVRPNGHILPENVVEELPKAVEAIRKKGLEVYMITTAIANAEDTFTEPILRTAGSLGIPFYRMGWLEYNNKINREDNVEVFRKQLTELGRLGEKHNIKGAYQNHAGTSFGSAVLDLYMALKNVHSKWIGCQYDIRHATVEGANSWPVGLDFIKPHINTINLKDFNWATTGGKTREQNVPLGTGNVDFEKYVNYLKEMSFIGPVCLHFEYPLGGAEDGAKKITIHAGEVFKAMRRDLEIARTWFAST